MIGNLVSSGERAAHFAAALVPNFGNKSASLFSIALFLETFFRNGLQTESTKKLSQNDRFSFVSLLKDVQLATCLVATSAFNSYVDPTVAIVGAMVLSRPEVWYQMAMYTSAQVRTIIIKEESEVKWTVVTCEQVRADRPSLYLMLRCCMSIAYIAATVIQSLAVGVVAEKTFKAGVGGKVQFVVSAALLSLSFYNVLNRRELFKQL